MGLPIGSVIVNRNISARICPPIHKAAEGDVDADAVRADLANGNHATGLTIWPACSPRPSSMQPDRRAASRSAGTTRRSMRRGWNCPPGRRCGPAACNELVEEPERQESDRGETTGAGYARDLVRHQQSRRSLLRRRRCRQDHDGGGDILWAAERGACRPTIDSGLGACVGPRHQGSRQHAAAGPRWLPEASGELARHDAATCVALSDEMVIQVLRARPG